MIINDTLNIRISRDGINFATLEFLYCKTRDNRFFRMIVGATSDGMSGGKLVKAILQDQDTFLEAVFHDGCYRDKIEESKDDGETWVKYSPTWEESNLWLKQNIIEAGGGEAEAEIVWLGVSTSFGKKDFDDDRAEYG
jgi:hypothetical protein